MSLRYLMIFAAMTFLVGCASRMLENYTGPDSTSVEFVAGGTHRLTTALYSDDLDCYGMKYVTAFEVFTTKTAVVKEKPFITFEYQYSDTTVAGVALCGGIYTLPAAGSNIRVQLERSGTNCRMSVLKQSKSNQTWAPADGVVLRKKTQPAVDQEGPWCTADPRFQGSSLLPTPRKAQ